MQVFVDPDAAKRSLMLKQKRLCNGESTGIQCKHYWAFRTLIDVDNPDHLRKGENARRCLVQSGQYFEMGDGGGEMAVYCNRFEEGHVPFDPDFESYDPMTPEEIKALEVEYAADPASDALQRELLEARRLAGLGEK